jgi:hypothetical protein
MFVSVLARRLRPGKTYDDFVRAWYPEKGFGVPVRGPFLARNIEDDREILAVAFVDIAGRENLADGLAQVAAQEAARRDTIDEVIESTAFRGLFELTAEFDFSTDESVAHGRP